MNLTIDDFFLRKDTLSIIDKWKLQYDKPLLIYGIHGIGKTSLANILLDNYNIIEYSELNDIQNMNKTDIYSMVNPNYKIKSLVIDIFSKNKELLQNIDKVFTLINTPIILITTENNHKINVITKKCYSITLKYTNKQYISIINKISKYKNIEVLDYNELLSSSNYSISNILINIEFYKGSSNDIITYDINHTTLNLSIDLLHKYYSISELFNLYCSDYIIIINNIIDNIHNVLNYSDEFFDIILELYCSILTYKNMYIDSINIFFYIVYPYYLLNYYKLLYGINSKCIVYNKYISKKITYISMVKYIITGNDIEHIYSNITEQLIHNNKKKTTIKINKKLLNFYYKLYNFHGNKLNMYQINKFLKS
tara:strand:+ start:1051 stop:2151 length:1101 start_codon:yes stop_codon:yes gene_type:complete